MKKHGVEIVPHTTKDHQSRLLEFASHSKVAITIHCSGKIIPQRHPNFEVNGNIYNFLRKYVAGPTISDSFGPNHGLRRQFKLQLQECEPNVYAWLENNRLSFNHLQAIQLTLQLFPQTRKTRRILRQLAALLPKNAIAYDLLTTKQKVSLTNQVASLAEELYIAVSL